MNDESQDSEQAPPRAATQTACRHWKPIVPVEPAKTSSGPEDAGMPDKQQND